MKRIVLLLLMISPAICMMAGEKVLERSARRAPGWLYGMEKGYIIASAEERTIEAAREEVMLQVKERLLTSIAEHVRTEARHDIQETNHNGELESLSRFYKQVRTNAAAIPYLNGISESKVSDYYWEKVQLDKTTIVYRYHIRYPLPEIEIRMLSKAFKEDQARITSELETLRRTDFALCESVEQMTEAFVKARALQTELGEEDPRYETCRAALSSMQQQLVNLHWVLINSDKEEAVVMLFFGEKAISCNQRLTLRSNCLSKMNFISEGEQQRITYDSSGCYDDEENYIAITLMVGSRKVSEKIYLEF